MSESKGSRENLCGVCSTLSPEKFRTSRRQTRVSGMDLYLDNHVLVIEPVEEVRNNLLPRASSIVGLMYEPLWASCKLIMTGRARCELDVCVDFATQAPSSIMPEILSETDRLGYLAYLTALP